MKKILFVLTLIVVYSTACRKDDSLLNLPIADFSFAGNINDSITIAVYDGYTLINNSTNADSFIWDLGNGTTSTDKQLGLYYVQSGVYTVTLTAFNKEGQTSVTSKKVRVVDPIVNEIVIDQLNWNTSWGWPSSWPVFSKADIWVEILKGESNQNYPVLSNGVFDAPLIFKSEVAVGIDPSSIPVVFNVPQEIVIDMPTLLKKPPYQGAVGYIFNFYAKDATGTYLLCSNNWSGGNWKIITGSISTNRFSLGSGNFVVYMHFNGYYK